MSRSSIPTVESSGRWGVVVVIPVSSPLPPHKVSTSVPAQTVPTVCLTLLRPPSSSVSVCILLSRLVLPLPIPHPFKALPLGPSSLSLSSPLASCFPLSVDVSRGDSLPSFSLFSLPTPTRTRARARASGGRVAGTGTPDTVRSPPLLPSTRTQSPPRRAAPAVRPDPRPISLSVSHLVDTRPRPPRMFRGALSRSSGTGEHRDPFPAGTLSYLPCDDRLGTVRSLVHPQPPKDDAHPCPPPPSWVF